MDRQKFISDILHVGEDETEAENIKKLIEGKFKTKIIIVRQFSLYEIQVLAHNMEVDIKDYFKFLEEQDIFKCSLLYVMSHEKGITCDMK